MDYDEYIERVRSAARSLAVELRSGHKAGATTTVSFGTEGKTGTAILRSDDPLYVDSVTVTITR